MELTYHREGDYLYPNLVLEPEEPVILGKFMQNPALCRPHPPYSAGIHGWACNIGRVLFGSYRI